LHLWNRVQGLLCKKLVMWLGLNGIPLFFRQLTSSPQVAPLDSRAGSLFLQCPGTSGDSYREPARTSRLYCSKVKSR
jgi:hypothetical protein